MNHKAKSFIFKSLDILPNSLGYGIYHQLQKFLNRNSVNFKIKTNNRSFKEALEILEKENISLKDKTVLELGSGWAPIIPYFFTNFAEVERVVTYDINEHYDAKTIAKLNSYYKENYQIDIAAEKGKYPLPSNVTYYPKTNLAAENTQLNEQIDLVFSRFVLEHISPEDLLQIHQSFANILPKSAYILHMISPSDHRAYDDKSLSYYDFLKYSKAEWKKQHTKFDYHNRLRLPDYLTIFKEAGYEVVSLDYDTCDKDSEKYKKFKELTLHEDYKNYTEEELLAGSINVLLKLKV
ncbi:methyltransferase family protein [Kordia periserrulae]|uniref:Methyltransferase family protein n=1 Tax=Kordia periserrulae TaxID=701523 RepID=A0A2T6BZJ9_9FLAO|nr:methyltransferase domain-containing protein [Kordia periserrulae]PTX61417.1 methyltransferase family protein [Kordia periserrulae]